jgi:hypothetical protein
MNEISVFNNVVEVGLRISIVLKTIYPATIDIERLNYVDYFSLHSSDVGGEESLHSPVPNRFGELSVKREIIQQSLNFLILKGLAERKYIDSGIEYIASDLTELFIENLHESYSLNYSNRVSWVIKKFNNQSIKDIRDFVQENYYKWGSEMAYKSVGQINE